MAALRRLPAVVALCIIAVIVMLGAGFAHADTTEYFYQGTGPTRAIGAADVDHDANSVVNMSTDRNWQAQFAPAYGKQTMDTSVSDGTDKGYDEIADNLEAGNTVTVKGFSLGALTADQIGRQLGDRGVDTSNLKVDVISDGYQPNTGALVVLRPIAGLLKPLGISTAGPVSHPEGQWTYHCIKGDGVCHLASPALDPVSTVEGVVGYLTYHSGSDPVYNYANRANLQSTTVTDGNVTTVTYDAPHPITRWVEVQTGSTQFSPILNKVLDTLETSTGDPGQQRTYKPLEELQDGVSKLMDNVKLPIEAPAATPAPEAVAAPVAPPVQDNSAPVAEMASPAPVQQPVYDVPAPVQQAAQQVWQQAAPVVQHFAPQVVQPIHDLAGQFGITLP